MKKICIVKEDITQKGGSERIACLLMNELSNKFEVYCISIKKANDIPAYPLNSKIKIKYLSSSSKRIRYQLVKLLFKYINIVLKNKIDIILNIGVGGIAISFISKLFNNKIISCEHSNLKNLNDNLSKRKCQFLTAIFSNKVITLTEKDRINYIQKFNLSEDRVDYIYNFIDDELLNLKNKYNINSKKIITVGRFDKVKGYDRLVKIAKKVLEKNKDWEWHIYGNGEEFKNIKTLIKENQLEDRLILKGKVDNIYELYKEYSFYVMTSYYEGLPMVLLEAKANNLPLISFDIETGPSEIIRNGVDGYLIENNNLEEIEEKINYLIVNKNIRKEFSDRSKENLDKFEKNKIINRWLEIINGLN